MNNSASDLQLQLARNIARAISEGTIKEGEHLRETELSTMFSVSRSPVRAALGLLLDVNLVEKQANRGFFVAADRSEYRAFLDSLPKTDDEQIKESIAKDWFNGTISKEVSEGEIRRRYCLGRLTTQRILNSLSEDGIVSRMPGYGWQFEPTLNSWEAHDESYDFRMIVEPSGIRSSTFRYDRSGGEVLRARHELIVDSRESEWNSADLFRLDADFHGFVAQCSCNRFVVQAVQQQNRLRRLLEYNSLLNTGRLMGSCLEHLNILDGLDKGNLKRAAKAMTLHLKNAKDAGPDFRQS